MGILGICVMFLCFQIGRYAANVFTKVDAAPETTEETVTLSPLEERITSGEWEVKAYCTCENVQARNSKTLLVQWAFYWLMDIL